MPRINPFGSPPNDRITDMFAVIGSEVGDCKFRIMTDERFHWLLPRDQASVHARNAVNKHSQRKIRNNLLGRIKSRRSFIPTLNHDLKILKYSPGNFPGMPCQHQTFTLLSPFKALHRSFQKSTRAVQSPRAFHKATSQPQHHHSPYPTFPNPAL